jgi:hypothetical protein
MVKFGKKLHSEMVPEWAAKYVPYRSVHSIFGAFSRFLCPAQKNVRFGECSFPCALRTWLACHDIMTWNRSDQFTCHVFDAVHNVTHDATLRRQLKKKLFDMSTKERTLREAMKEREMTQAEMSTHSIEPGRLMRGFSDFLVCVYMYVAGHSNAGEHDPKNVQASHMLISFPSVA